MITFKAFRKKIKPNTVKTSSSDGVGKFPNIKIAGVYVNDAINDSKILDQFISYYMKTINSKSAKEIKSGRKMTNMEREDFYDWFRKHYK